jgi:hypothetical protein
MSSLFLSHLKPYGKIPQNCGGNCGGEEFHSFFFATDFLNFFLFLYKLKIYII